MPDTLTITVPSVPAAFPSLPHREREVFPGDILLLFVIFSVVLFAFIKAMFSRIFIQVFTATFDDRTSLRIFADRTELHRNMSTFLHVLFYLNLSLFFHEWMKWQGVAWIDLPEWITIPALGGAIALLALVKILICKLLGVIFLRTNFFDEYLHQTFVFYKAYGVVLTLPVFVIPLLPGSWVLPFFGAGLGAGVLLLLLWLIRSFQIIVRHRFSVFYFLLYLCTLEIIPVLVIIKTLQGIM